MASAFPAASGAVSERTLNGWNSQRSKTPCCVPQGVSTLLRCLHRQPCAAAMSMIRLQKFLSAAGVCSRRHGEELIRQGRVRVNGRVVTELGVKVDPGQYRVEVDGKPVGSEPPPVYIALHKPRGYVTSCRHPGKKIILELVDFPERVFPIGRLDKDSSGLLLLTNDGRLHHRLSHPSFDHEKEYEVTVERPISDGALARMAQGLPILGTRTRPAEVVRISARRFRIVLKEGRNRQIRRMVRRVSNEVLTLKRIRFATVRLGTIAEGAWRHLTAHEVRRLLRALEENGGGAPGPPPVCRPAAEPDNGTSMPHTAGRASAPGVTQRPGWDRPARSGIGRSPFARKPAEQAPDADGTRDRGRRFRSAARSGRPLRRPRCEPDPAETPGARTGRLSDSGPGGIAPGAPGGRGLPGRSRRRCREWPGPGKRAPPAGRRASAPSLASRIRCSKARASAFMSPRLRPLLSSVSIRARAASGSTRYPRRPSSTITAVLPEHGAPVMTCQLVGCPDGRMPHSLLRFCAASRWLV